MVFAWRWIKKVQKQQWQTEWLCGTTRNEQRLLGEQKVSDISWSSGAMQTYQIQRKYIKTVRFCSNKCTWLRHEKEKKKVVGLVSLIELEFVWVMTRTIALWIGLHAADSWPVDSFFISFSFKWFAHDGSFAVLALIFIFKLQFEVNNKNLKLYRRSHLIL